MGLAPVERPRTRAWTPSNGVTSTSAPLSGSTTCRCQFSSPPVSCEVDEVAVVRGPGVRSGSPRSRSFETGRGAVAAERRRPTRSGRRRPGRCGPAGVPSGDDRGASRSGFPKRTSRGIRSTIGRRLYPGAAVGRRPYTPADGFAPDRHVRLRRRRPDGAARVPGHAARTRTSSTSATRSPDRFPYGPKPADDDPPLRPRDRHPPGGARREADRRRLQRRHRRRRCPSLQREFAVPLIGVITPEAHAAVQVTRNRRVGVMATQATVDERPLPGGGARCSTPASR